MLLRKEQGGSTIAGYEWPTDGSVCEVPAELGLELLTRPGFSEVLPDPEPVDEADGGTGGGEGDNETSGGSESDSGDGSAQGDATTGDGETPAALAAPEPAAAAPAKPAKKATAPKTT